MRIIVSRRRRIASIMGMTPVGSVVPAKRISTERPAVSIISAWISEPMNMRPIPDMLNPEDIRRFRRRSTLPPMAMSSSLCRESGPGQGNRDLNFRTGRKITVQSYDPTDPKVVAATIIDCGGTTADPHRGFIFTSGETNDSILSGLTITNGIVANGTAGLNGGGILCQNASPKIEKCVIRNCTAWNGGGVFFTGITNASLKDCELSSNTATSNSNGDGGGGVACYRVTGQIQIERCWIHHNNATGNDGGGILILNCSPTILSCRIQGNTALIEPEGRGGGIWIGRYPGTALYQPIIQNCTIEGNLAYDGGGIRIYQTAPQIINCSFTGNTAKHSGGAIHTAPISTSMKLLNCSVFANRASGKDGGSGGGVFSETVSMDIANCIFWGNTFGGSNTLSQIVNTKPVTFSCIQGGAVVNGNISSDPSFLCEPDDGGDGWGDDPTTANVDEGANDDYGDLRLMPGSPCIDAGTNSPTGMALPTTDILGGPRKWDDPDKNDTGYGTAPIADMGAYEYCGSCDGGGRAGQDGGVDPSKSGRVGSY